MRHSLRRQLEDLNSDELLERAERMGIDIPPKLDRLFIIEELLDASGEIDAASDTESRREPDAGMELLPDGESEPELPAERQESAAIPQHYNKTYIGALIRDPLWIFVYWEVKQSEKEAFQAMPDFDGYRLRVVFMHEAFGENGKPDELFSVQVTENDTSWYLNFQCVSEPFRVELCIVLDGETQVLAVTPAISLPPLLGKSCAGNDTGVRRRLTQLSGYDDLPILRNTDRITRIPHKFENRAGASQKK
jgi:hypothetical protein